MSKLRPIVSVPARLHPTAVIEPSVEIGAGSAIWDHVHIRGPARIGQDCIIGEKTYVAYGVSIGNCVKINAHVYICTGVTISDRVMISAGVVFTNDRYPRAFDDGGGLAASGPTADTLHTIVHEGATVGAGAVIGPGVVIGAFAMVGMGSVVVRSVPPHGLVRGNPARVHGHVCVCGAPLPDLTGTARDGGRAQCTRCGRSYSLFIDSAGQRPLFMAGA